MLELAGLRELVAEEREHFGMLASLRAEGG